MPLVAEPSYLGHLLPGLAGNPQGETSASRRHLSWARAAPALDGSMVQRSWNTLQHKGILPHLWGLILGLPGEGSLGMGLWVGAGRER